MNDTPNDPLTPAKPISFRHILPLLAEGVAVLHNGHVIYANAALCELSGLNRGEIVGCPFLDMVVEGDRRRVAAYLQSENAASHGSVTFRLQRDTSAGRQVRMQASAMQLQGIYRNSTGICCSLMDITDFQDRITELRRDNRRMRIHLDDTESVLMAVAPYDCRDILMVNKYVEALLGCSIRDITSGRRHLFDFVHPVHLEPVVAFYNAFPDVHENAELEYRIIGKDHRIRWVRDMGNTLFVERGHGMPRCIDHTLVDITEQKNKEIELEEKRRKLDSIFQNSSEMIYRVDRAGTFLDLNPAGLKLLGITGDFEGLNILDFYKDPNQRNRMLSQLQETGQAQQLAKWKIADGVEIDVVINAVAEKAAAADDLIYQGIVHNVTRTLELQRMNTIKKMAGGLSDQINTPLMILSMGMEMIRELLEAGEEDREAILEQLDEMAEAYQKIVASMSLVREKYWAIEEVSDGCGGTIYEIHEHSGKA